jgi:hypothetical protein
MNDGCDDQQAGQNPHFDFFHDPGSIRDNHFLIVAIENLTQGENAACNLPDKVVVRTCAVRDSWTAADRSWLFKTISYG